LTLEQLQSIQAQLKAQYKQRLEMPLADESQLALMHCNAIELRGALQLVAQLIIQENVVLAAPPGATGPGI
jgi:hypothetical protein